MLKYMSSAELAAGCRKGKGMDLQQLNWYMIVAAFVLMGIGVVVMRRTRRDIDMQLSRLAFSLGMLCAAIGYGIAIVAIAEAFQ
jgi:hypothetical protein